MNGNEDPQRGSTDTEPPAKPARHTTARRIAKWAALGAAGLVLLVVLGLSTVMAFGISLDLSGLRGRVEAAASENLHRPVSINGPLRLVPSLWPTLQIEEVHVGNPTGWPDADFARLGLARAQFGVLALLRGEARIEEITVEGLALNLVRDADGRANWLPKEGGERPQAESGPSQAASSPPLLEFVELQRLSLANIELGYRNAVTGAGYRLRFDEISGDAQDRQPMHLQISGSLQSVPYELSLTAGSLVTLLDAKAPWNLELSATAATASLSVSGEIAEPLQGKGLALVFDFKGPDMETVEAILGTKLPPVRSLDLNGRIVEAEGIYRLSDLQGELGGSAFTGDLEVVTSATPPNVHGTLDVPRLDLGIITAAVEAAKQTQDSGEAAEDSGQTQPPAQAPDDGTEASAVDIDEEILTLDALASFNAEVALTVGEVANAPIDIADASLKLLIQDGNLSAPMRARVAGVTFAGDINLTAPAEEPDLQATLSAEGSDIGHLPALLLGAEGIEGAFGSAELALSARGRSIRSLLETTTLRFSLADASLSYGHEAEATPVEFTLADFRMTMPGTGESKLSAKGTLLDEAFTLNATGGTFVEAYVTKAWPVTLDAQGGGADLTLKGTVRQTGPDSGSSLRFSLAGARLGSLSKWTGLSPQAKVPYKLAGTASLSDSGAVIEIQEGRVGNSGFTGLIGVEQQSGRPISLAKLAFEVIDIDQLRSLLPADEAKRAKASGEDTFTIDMPILPRGFALVDSDLDVKIGRIMSRPHEVSDVSFSAKIRDGHMKGAPLHAVFAGAAIDGTSSIDLRGDVPALDLLVHTGDIDIGQVLEQLGIVEDLAATAGRLDLDLRVRGADLRTILQQSTVSADIRDGLLRLRDPNSGGRLDIALPQGSLKAPAGESVALTLEGLIDRIPLSIAIQTDSLASFSKKKDSLNAEVRVNLLNSEITLTGTTPLPLDPQDLRFTLALAGDRVSDLDGLFSASLPPWGPYTLAGSFGTLPSGYFIEDLKLGIGESSLSGALRLETTFSPPRLTVDLTAHSVQLDDFDTGEWSATRKEAEAAPQAAESGQDMQALLSPQALHRLDGKVSVAVEEVLSGTDRLGRGSLLATLEQGRLSVDPLHLEVPGGEVSVGFDLEPGENGVALGARAKIDRLDYGILARRIDPQSTTGGLISLDLDLSTRGPNLAQVMTGANGHIDFAVWPQDLNAGLFDLWAVNLFTSVLPSLDSEASKVNCLVARFGLQDGLMRPTAVLVDTTRIQATADGEIDFRDDSIALRAAPRPKKPQMFSAQTPISINGHFSDFALGTSPGALMGTVVRMLSSPLVVPFQWVFTEKVAADGKAACDAAWAGPTQN